jgi:hypothetical protein
MISSVLALPLLLQSIPYDGVTLFSPMSQNDVFLVDNSGATVHTWPGSHLPGLSVYLTEDYDLVRTNRVATGQLPAGHGGGLQRMDWNGNVLWDYQYYSPSQHLQHHDIEVLPNGNILLIAWKWKTRQEAINVGRNPAYLNSSSSYPFLPDHIAELQPVGTGGANIVWEWNVWDHLIQDFDPTKPNYGVIANYPERVNINYPPLVPSGDWNHLNTVSYNEELDQVMLTSRHFSELWIIDHSTTTAEAAGSTGGNYGVGGDLLYRWGNAEAYGRGTPADKELFSPHDAIWIAPNRMGAGNIIVFDNGLNRPAGPYSTVDEIAPPITAAGDYSISPGAPYGPVTTTWEYIDPVPTNFYSSSISGCERLPNDNTLICSGDQAWIFEVDPAGNIVWEYFNTIPNPANSRVFKARRYGVTDSPQSQCEGTGAGIACPCGNNGGPGEGCANSTGQGAVLTSSGAPRILSDSLALQITQGTISQPVLFFQGNNAINGGNGNAFGDGIRCCGGAVKRLQVRFMNASGSATSTTSISLAGATSVGDVRCYQGWYRDPSGSSGSPCGNSFNLTNGLTLTWVP